MVPDLTLTTYTWDPEGRMSATTDDPFASAFAIYRRWEVRRGGVSVGGTSSFGFSWDAENLIQGDVHGVSNTKFTQEPAGYGNVLSDLDVGSGISSFYHFDGLGSTDRQTDAAGADLTAVNIYDAGG